MENRQKIRSGILGRVKVLYIVFAVICIGIVAQILYIQLGPNSDKLQKLGVENSVRNDILEARRGDILSDDGRILATSIPYYEIRMDMVARGLDSAVFYQNVGALADSLSRYFRDKSSAEYKRLLLKAKSDSNAFFRINSRKIDYLQLGRIKRFPIFELGPKKGGFIAIETGRRIQPYGKMAARSIGFVNTEGVRVGIEGGFENYLRGTDGVSKMQKISGTFWIPVASPANVEPINGLDVVTTFNIELQSFVQNALIQRLVETEADWGSVIVMHTKTGHIKAISNATRLATGQIVEDYNYAIGMSQEPGSTFKIAAMLALLDDAKMPLSEMIETGGGRAQIGPVTVVDATSGGYGTLSLQGIFEKSSNVGFAKAVNKYYSQRPAKYVDAINRLGLNKELGLQIAGEARPVVKYPGKPGWDGMTLTMMSYGYAIRVTPMQTLTLANAIANGGVMVKPQFVTELKQMGNTVQRFATDTVIPHIVGDKALRDVRTAMEGVVLNGTAKSLKNPNYTVAAKTGTAQIAMGNKGYRDNGGRHYLGSIVGYFPADKPEYTIMIAMKTFTREGSGKAYYGGALSAPLFKGIADHIYNSNYQFVKPIVPTVTILKSNLAVKSGDERELNDLIQKLRIVPNSSKIEVVGSVDKSDTTEKVVVKSAISVHGYTMTRAVEKLEDMGYTVNAHGRGVVVRQDLDSIRRRINLYLQ